MPDPSNFCLTGTNERNVWKEMRKISQQENEFMHAFMIAETQVLPNETHSATATAAKVEIARHANIHFAVAGHVGSCHKQKKKTAIQGKLKVSLRRSTIQKEEPPPSHSIVPCWTIKHPPISGELSSIGTTLASGSDGTRAAYPVWEVSLLV